MMKKVGTMFIKNIRYLSLIGVAIGLIIAYFLLLIINKSKRRETA